MTHLIGIDLGGTKINGVLLASDSGAVIAQQRIPTEGQHGPDAVLDRIAELGRSLCNEANIALTGIQAVGIGAPSIIDYDNGRTLLTPNIPGDWYGKPVERDLGTRIQRPVWLVNDARAFTLAEATLGAGRGHRIVACFTLGTGIGGGIVIDGRLHLGLGGNAGEFGHITVDVHGKPDGSGTPGAIEAYGTGPAIAAAGINAVMQGFTTQIGALVNYDLNQITPRTVMDAAANGDAVALDILETAGKYIGAGVANVITILGPHCVVFGGGVAALGDWILGPIRRAVDLYSNTVELDTIAFVTAQLGDNAGAMGAALWASQRQAGSPEAASPTNTKE